MFCPEQRLYLAIVKQAIKDYAKIFDSQDEKKQQLKQEIINWVNNGEGTFQLCSIAWSKDDFILREKLKVVFRKIENGKRFKVLSQR